MTENKRVNRGRIFFDETELNGENIDQKTGKVRKKKVATMPPRNKEEYQRIINHVYTEHSKTLACIFEIQAETGLRYSDASCLMFSDFYDSKNEFRKSFVVYQQKIFYGVEGQMLRSGKSQSEAKNIALKKSQIRLAITDTIKEIVEHQRQHSGSDEYLFVSKHHRSSGRPMTLSNADKIMRKVQAELGIEYQLRSHSFRKYFAKRLIEAKFTLLEIRDLLGHTQLSTTNNYLVTFSDELTAKVIDFFDKRED